MSPASEIEAKEAAPEIQSIFRDIQYVLRVSDVPWLFRLLASHPAFLKAAWIAVKPTITDYFERSADLVRAAAVSQITSSLTGTDLIAKLKKLSSKSDWIAEITENVLVQHYIAPKLLLISSAVSAAVAERRADVNSIVVFPTGRGIPIGMPRIVRANPESASGKIREVFQEVAKAHSLPVSPDLLLALGQWPDALSLLWDQLRSAAQSPKYPDVLEKINSSAAESVQHLRRRMDLGREELALAGVAESERIGIADKLETAMRYYKVSAADSAYLALSLAGPEAAGLPGEALLIRWALPR